MEFCKLFWCFFTCRMEFLEQHKKTWSALSFEFCLNETLLTRQTRASKLNKKCGKMVLFGQSLIFLSCTIALRIYIQSVLLKKKCFDSTITAQHFIRLFRSFPNIINIDRAWATATNDSLSTFKTKEQNVGYYCTLCVGVHHVCSVHIRSTCVVFCWAIALSSTQSKIRHIW